MTTPKPQSQNYPDKLYQAYQKRYKALKKRSQHLNLPPPDHQQLWQKLLKNYHNGFTCSYCNKRMKITEQQPSMNTFTLDHIQPLHHMGTNQVDNITIVCRQCNIKKGVLPINIYKKILNQPKPQIKHLSTNTIHYFKLTDDGWTSQYTNINNLLSHLKRRSKSLATRKNYLYHIKAFCQYTTLTPTQTTTLPKHQAETLIQHYTDTYNNDHYSRQTANFILTVLKTFYKTNGYKNHNQLDIERYYTPTRYRKTKEYIPAKHEIYQMADAATSLRDKTIILTIYSTGLRNSTLRSLIYQDIKNEINQPITNIKISIYPEMKQRIPEACKNHLPYYTFLCDEATQTLKLYLNKRSRTYGPIQDFEPLFASQYTHYNKTTRTHHHLTSRQLQKIIKNSAQNANITQWNNIKAHTLRKTYKTILRTPNIDNIRLDTETKDFLFGHSIPGSRDPYYDKTKTEELRNEYAKLKFGRVNIENKYKKLHNAITQAFEGTGEDIDKILQEYINLKHQK